MKFDNSVFNIWNVLWHPPPPPDYLEKGFSKGWSSQSWFKQCYHKPNFIYHNFMPQFLTDNCLLWPRLSLANTKDNEPTNVAKISLTWIKDRLQNDLYFQIINWDFPYEDICLTKVLNVYGKLNFIDFVIRQ